MAAAAPSGSGAGSSGGNMNGTTNGLNGKSNGHHAHSPSSSSMTSGGQDRVLQLVHSESGTRLSIPGVPEQVYGLASDLRDEFMDHLRDSGKYAKLIPEQTDDNDEDEDVDAAGKPGNNSGLLLASYWLQFLAPQHDVARPVLAASRAFFGNKYLQGSTLDIHAIASKLDVDEKKAVIGGWIAVCAKLGDEDFGPRGKLWDSRSSSKTSLYAVFGGQGSNEYYWDEMEYLYEVYGSLFTPLLIAGQSVLSSLAEKHASTLLYPNGLTPATWLAVPSSRPSVPYLASCAVSLPLIGLVQMCQYMATARIQGLTPDQVTKVVKGATGHSQGVVSAAVIAMGGATWDDYIKNASEGLKVLFAIGLRGTEAFPPLSLSPAVVAQSVESGEGVPYPMLAVTGLLQPALEAKIKETNAYLSQHGKGEVNISLFNGLKAFIVTGPPASLVGLVNNLKKGKAESGKDQSKIPFSKRLPVFSMRFLPIGVPYHSPYLSGCTAKAMQEDVDPAEAAAFWTRSKLQIPVYHTETGRDLRSASEQHKEGELVNELFDQVFSTPIHWDLATQFGEDATHVVDFGTGGQSGIGSLTAREGEGKGLRVVVASTGTNGRNIEEVYSAAQPRVDDKWIDRFGPRLVRTRHDGKIHLDTAMSRLLSKPPLMVAGMTPTTVGAGFNAAVLNAGYHIELAGGGHYNAKALRGKVDQIISQLKTPGIGLTLNALYINQRQFTFQLPEWLKMKGEGIPVEGLCVAAGIPSTENATKILGDLKAAGLKHVSFKPGSVEGIRQVINIASANPGFPIIMQWTGGRAGGHHSCEDFHQPVLATYASIRQHKNIVLVGGSGFGGADDVWPYLDGSWAKVYGVERMPFDGFLYASRVMVAKEAHTSLAVKKLIVAASGVDDSKWEGTYDKETGGIVTVKSELGEPIHKVATRGIKLWKEFENTVFAMPKEKRAAWLLEKKDYVIKRLNEDFQKPWFAAKADGKACDLGDMTYAEVTSRMVRLMYVAHEKRWIDPSLKKLTGDWLRRTEDRLSEVNDAAPKASALQSYNSLDDPQPFLTSFFEKYPSAKTQILASEDIAYFLAICQRPGQKPCPYIAVLDNNFEVWFKKDSLWFSEDVEAVFDQDPQRVCILQGPVAVKHCTKVDEPIADMFGGIRDKLIQNVLDEFYGGDESKVPVVEYLARRPQMAASKPAEQMQAEYNIKYSTRDNSSDDSTTHVYDIDGVLPPTAEWLEHLAGPKLDWLRAFLLSVNVSQGTKGLVANNAPKLFKPRKGQRVEVTLSNKEQRPMKVAVFGAIRN